MSPGTPALSMALIPRSDKASGIKAMAGLVFGSPKFGSVPVSAMKSPHIHWTGLTISQFIEINLITSPCYIQGCQSSKTTFRPAVIIVDEDELRFSRVKRTELKREFTANVKLYI